MDKNMRSKKGIFFTALLVLLSSTLLTLSVLSFHISLESEKRFVELSNLDVVYNLYGSIENSVRVIFFKTIGEDYVDVNYLENYVEFLWKLPTPPTENFKNILNELEAFIEERYNFIELNISEIIDDFPVFIKPYNISYRKAPDSWGGGFTSIIIPFNPDIIKKYEVNFDIEPTCGIRAGTCPLGSGINVSIQGCAPYSFNPNDPVACHFPLTFGDDIILLIEVHGGGEGSLAILPDPDFNVDVDIHSKVHIRNMTEQITVELPGNLIDVNIPGMNVKKKGSVRLI